MPRTPRLDHAGARHHVFNRIARKEGIFTTDAVCSMFLDIVAELPTLFGVRIHGFALMPNHYHLMVEVPRGNLPRAMRHLGAVFTQRYNRQMGVDGPLFRGRYRNELVQDDAYWMHLLAYLHLNPVKARLVVEPKDWLWTSHLAYLGELENSFDWLVTDELTAMFGSAQEIADYVREVQIKRREAPSGFDPERFWAGSSTVEAPQVTPPPVRSAEQAIADVAALFEIPADKVLEMKRGRKANTPAWIAVWWLLRATELTQAEVAELMGISRPRVSQIRMRLFELARKDEALMGRMHDLEDLQHAGA